MKKAELVKMWKQIDNACGALENLSHYNQGLELLEKNKIDFTALVALKNDLEEIIEQKTRTAKVDLK